MAPARGDAEGESSRSAESVEELLAHVDANLSRRIVQAAPVLIVVLDLEGRIEHVNPFFERLTGRRLEEVRGKDWFDTCLPERDRDRIRALFAQSRGGDHVAAYVNPVVSRTGEERQIEWTDEFLRDAEGRVTSILAIGQDVTQRVAAEVQHRAVIAAMHDGIVIHSASGRIAEANLAAQRMLGLSADQLVGRAAEDDCWSAVRGDGTPFSAGDHPALVTLRTGAPTNAVVMGLGRTGRDIVWLSVNAAPLLRAGDNAVVGVVTSLADITERWRTEQRLEQAQALAHVGSWEVHLPTKRTWWSDEAFRIVGMDHETQIASYEAYIASVHPDDRVGVNAAFERALEQRESYDLDHRVLTADGHLKYIHTQVRITFGPDGSAVLVEGTLQDISAQTLAAERLREAQRIAKVGSWELDLVTNSLVWSDEIFRIFEIDAVRFGASYEAFLDAIHPDDRVAVDEAYLNSLKTQQPYEISHRLRMADGRIKHVHERCETHYAADGTPLRSVGTVQDVTARVIAEERVRELDARFATAFHDNPIAMGIRRLRDDVIIEVNSRLEELTSRRREDLVGSTVGALNVYVDERQRERVVEYASRREPARDMEVKLRDAAGRTREVSMTVSYLSIGGEDCALASFVDITEHREREQLTRRHLLEKETLLREIHHRVKNNLQVIAGLVHFQAKKLSTHDDEVALAQLRQRIFAMTLLHERLYQSSDIARIDFGDYVRGLVAEQLRSSGLRKSIRIEVIAEDVLLPIELAMPSGLIISELVTNVLKYAFPAERSGAATVTVRRVGERIVLAVDDDGVGFPDAFDSVAGGSFGWEIVRALVRQLDGTVTATNDRGAHVEVSFPAPVPAEGVQS